MHCTEELHSNLFIKIIQKLHKALFCWQIKAYRKNMTKHALNLALSIWGKSHSQSHFTQFEIYLLILQLQTKRNWTQRWVKNDMNRVRYFVVGLYIIRTVDKNAEHFKITVLMKWKSINVTRMNKKKKSNSRKMKKNKRLSNI